MQRTLVLLICVGVLISAGCDFGSSLPEATGKASIRTVNAIPTSPEVDFLIEERTLGSIIYQGASAPVPYDDLSYTFNFEVFYAGDTSRRRFASRNVDIIADKDYTFLLSGTLANPTITTWEFDEQTFDAADTVFATRFAHAAASLGDLDYYFADAAVVPALGNQAATLSFGEAGDATDFTEGDYVLTVTTAGNPADVVYTSATTAFPARATYLTTAFDGDASDTAPIFVNAFSDVAGTVLLPDINNPPTIQFINASMELASVDIYDDETLTSQVVTDHDFRDVAPEIETAVGANNFFYTPMGDTSVVLIEMPLTAFGGLPYRSVAVGLASNPTSLPFLPDLRSVETGAKIAPFQASNNFAFVDLYAVEPGSSIDDVLPIRGALASGLALPSSVILAGSYDLYVTETAEKLALAGPYRIDVVAGDVVDMIIVDTVDPNVLDVLFLSGGPAP